MAQYRSEVLLPLGVEMVFHGITDRRESAMSFSLNPMGYGFLLQELLCQGATGYRLIDPVGTLKQLIKEPQVRLCDTKGGIKERAESLIRPTAFSLGLDGSQLTPAASLFSEPFVYGISLSGSKRKQWSDLLLVLNCTYQLMVGMKNRLQVDIPLPAYQAALLRLKDSSNDMRSGVVLSSLIGVARTYRSAAAGAPMLINQIISVADEPWARAFNDLVDDEIYREYCRTKNDLGWPAKVEASLDRLWVLTKRLVQSKKFQASVKTGQKLVKASTGLPADAVDINDPLFSSETYLPPIVSLSQPLRRASRAWTEHSGDQPLRFIVDGFEWFAESLDAEYQHGTFSLDRDWFVGLFTFGGTGEPREAQLEETFSRYFADNLSPPYLCPKHLLEISIENVSTKWQSDSIEIEVEGCCEEAMKETFSLMVVFKGQK